MNRLNYNSDEYKKKCRSVRLQMGLKGLRYAIYERSNEDKTKRLTICIAKLPSGQYVRGWAICSAEDNFCRAVGHYYAMVRALKAACNKKSSEWTNRQEVFDRFDHGDDETLISKSYPLPKASWNVLVNQGELRLLGGEA